MRIWRLLQCQRAEQRAGGGGGQGSTVEPQTDGPVVCLFGIDANVTGGSHPRRATGGDPAPRQESSCGRTFLTGVEQLLLVPFPSRQGASSAARVGSAGVRWHGATLLLPALLLALPSHSEALVALFGNRGSAAPRPAGPSQQKQEKYTYETVRLGGGGRPSLTDVVVERREEKCGGGAEAEGGASIKAEAGEGRLKSSVLL